MSARWVYLRMDADSTLAVPVQELHRVLHRGDPDYASFAPTARSLPAALGLPPDPSLPGVLVVFGDGGCWYVGDTSLDILPPGAPYCSIEPHLFAGTPWCRGVLVAESGHAFVTDCALLRAAFG